MTDYKDISINDGNICSNHTTDYIDAYARNIINGHM